MRVLFATAELAPLVRVGGLAEAASGLVLELRRTGIDVDVAVPDYFGRGATGTALDDQTEETLDVPAWVGGATARTGILDGFGIITLVDVPGIARPHPYLQTGSADGWPDNDRRFLAFSAAVAALARVREADVLHVNDWHTGAAIALSSSRLPTVASIHNLAYQGTCDGGWLSVLGDRAYAYEWYGGCNPLVGALKLADRVVAVSPNYANEIRTEAFGFGVDGVLRGRGDVVVGIINGIDADAWNPATDAALPTNFDTRGFRTGEAKGKATCRSALRTEVGLADSSGPIIGFVTRLVEQKGVDLALEAAAYLRSVNAQLVVLGAGDPWLGDRLRALESAEPGRVAFRDAFDLGLAHRIFAGSDLYLMPSRFEPCGLAQMQAMAYGTIPVVTDVGGLHDTVTDADDDPEGGTGIVSAGVSAAGVVDALHRAVRLWSVRKRRFAVIRNGMAIDWSWTAPAREYAALYAAVAAGRPGAVPSVDVPTKIRHSAARPS